MHLLYGNSYFISVNFKSDCLQPKFLVDVYVYVCVCECVCVYVCVCECLCVYVCVCARTLELVRKKREKKIFR